MALAEILNWAKALSVIPTNNHDLKPACPVGRVVAIDHYHKIIAGSPKQIRTEITIASVADDKNDHTRFYFAGNF